MWEIVCYVCSGQRLLRLWNIYYICRFITLNAADFYYTDIITLAGVTLWSQINNNHYYLSYLSVCTCLSAEDYLAQVQVCELLAECYLKQRKQHKAIELYKQALTALSHCQVTAPVEGSEVAKQRSSANQNSHNSDQ